MYEGIQFHSEELRLTQEADPEIRLLKEAILTGEDPKDLAFQSQDFWAFWNLQNDLHVANGVLVLRWAWP